MNYRSIPDLQKIAASDRPFLLGYTGGPTVLERRASPRPHIVRGQGHGAIYGLYATAEEAETARQAARDGRYLTIVDARAELEKANPDG